MFHSLFLFIYPLALTNKYIQHIKNLSFLIKSHWVPFSYGLLSPFFVLFFTEPSRIQSSTRGARTHAQKITNTLLPCANPRILRGFRCFSPTSQPTRARSLLKNQSKHVLELDNLCVGMCVSECVSLSTCYNIQFIARASKQNDN